MDMDIDLTEKLRQELLERGASLVGFADLSKIAKGALHTGVSVAMALPAEVLQQMKDGPHMPYFDAYHALNAKLNALVSFGAKWLGNAGWRACAQTTDAVKEYGGYQTELPHKTVATQAGLGWIGKSALLVTEEYGPALRLSSLLTDAPLCCGTPVTASCCGSCHSCVDVCPAGAISGKLWLPGLEREALFSAVRCHRTARLLADKSIHKEITLCGHCIAACPYAIRYLQKIRAKP